MSTPRTAGYRARPTIDQYGRQTYPALVPPAVVKKIKRNQTRFVHRTPNGFNDPITNYHLVLALLDADPAQAFTAGHLTAWLNTNTPEIRWDSVTVGRALNALREYWAEANGEDLAPLAAHRYYDGVFYQVAAGPTQHKLIADLVEDLRRLCEEVVEEEQAGVMPKRLETPLNDCPSLMTPLARAG